MTALEQVERVRELIQVIGEAQAEMATLIGGIYYAVEQPDPSVDEADA